MFLTETFNILFNERNLQNRYNLIRNVPVITYQNNNPININLVKLPLTVKSSYHAFQLFWAHWNHKCINIQEDLMVLFLASCDSVLALSLEDSGNINSCVCPFMRILSTAKKIGAAKIFVGHNHPFKASILPSWSDIKEARRFKKLAQKNNLSLKDEIIISPFRSYFSLKKWFLL